MKKLSIFPLLGKSLILFASLSVIPSCTEEIDESNFTIKSEQTAADFIESNEDYSMMEEVLRKVQLGNSEGASPIFSVLTARGNYTVFLANNKAVTEYLKGLGLTKVEEMEKEQLELIAKSCIIDNQNRSAYESADFPIKGTFVLPNLVDRLLMCKQEDDGSYLINSSAHVISSDHEVSNGMIHIIDKVLAPSNMKLAEMIEKTPNLKIFSRLLKETTWCDSMQLHFDVSYENPDRQPVININKLAPFYSIEHRYYGYTAFVETDSVYQVKWGIQPQVDEEGNLTNWEEIYPVIKSKCEAVYGTMAPDQLTNADNAVNRFVAYHLIEGKVPYNRFVWHFNEINYQYGQAMNPQLVNCPTNVWDFYTSMGKYRGILKVTQVGDAGFEHDMEHTMRLNRISTYANQRDGDYHETGIVDGFAGLVISPQNGNYDNNSLNGYYYPLSDILFYTDDFRQQLYQRRLRIDYNSVFTELISNNVRGGIYRAFENNYFRKISRISPETQLCYIKMPATLGWHSFQGDYFLVTGIYDFTVELPPVPKDGTYEIRMSVVHNSERGMCQIYFGDDPDRLKPVGLPYDMRQLAGPSNPAIPWIEDSEDEETNQLIQKNLRNQGYMKAPQYYTTCNGKGDTPARKRSGNLRRIVTVADMKADRTYYLRYKSALKKNDSQCQLDYLEYASTAVFNSVSGEDFW